MIDRGYEGVCLLESQYFLLQGLSVQVHVALTGRMSWTSSLSAGSGVWATPSLVSTGSGVVHLITALYRNWYGPPHHRSLQELVWSTSSPLSTGTGMVHLITALYRKWCGPSHQGVYRRWCGPPHQGVYRKWCGPPHQGIYKKWCGPPHHNSLREVVWSTSSQLSTGSGVWSTSSPLSAGSSVVHLITVL